MADEQRMPYKQYAKFEKLFFLYGSTVKMLEPVRLNEWRTVSEQIWAWAKEKVSSVVEEYTDEFLDPPPEVGTPRQESPDESVLQDANTSQQKCITVKSVELLRTGQTKNGGAWKLSKVLATDGVSYTTFAGHRYEVGKEYTIEYEVKQSGSFIDYRIKEPK
jgi:hypothetical protein